MDTFLLLILLLIIGFLSLFFINQKSEKKNLNFLGIEFLFIGILIGEPFINFLNNTFQLSLPALLDSTFLQQLKPVVITIIGAMGFFIGFQFRIKDLFNLSIEQFKLSITDSFSTILLISGISFLIMNSFFSNLITEKNLVLNSLIIGIASSTFSVTAIEILKNKFKIEGNNFNTLCTIPKLNNFIAVSFVGLILALFHQNTTKNIFITPIEWFVISILIGLLLGFLFFIFLEREENEDKLILALLGIILFSSGSAYYLNLSPLFLNLLVGFVLGNLFKSKEVLNELFRKIEKFLYIIILIYAGSLIKIDNFLIFISGLFIYLILRYSIKYFNGWFAYKLSFDKSIFDRTIGIGLNSQGIIAIVMIINFHLFYDNPLTNTIFSIIVIASLINEFLSIKLVKDLLIDLNEIK